MNKIFIKAFKYRRIFSFFIISPKKRKCFRETCDSYDRHNRIIVVDDKGNKTFVKKYPGLHITFWGHNNLVILDSNIHFTNSAFSLYDNNKVVIKQSEYPVSLKIDLRMNTELEIGSNFQSSGTEIYNTAEPGVTVKIGNDCLFSWDTLLWASDGHSITDIKRIKALNAVKKGIEIGDHVWLGHGVHILKEVSIPKNSVIGMNSLVNRSFVQENSIFAGSPAKIIKEGINWDRKNAYDFNQTNKKKG